MAFVLVGVVLIVCHLAGWGPMAQWTWALTGDLWKFCLPFVLAALWWGWADASGLTKRRAMLRDDENKARRRERNIAALGLGHLHKRRDK